MGYETRLIFVSNSYKKSGKFHDYCHIEASLEMGKIAYDNVGALIEKSKVRDIKDELKKLVEEWESKHNDIYNSNGDYTESAEDMPEKEREREIRRLCVVENKLSVKLPYIFETNGNKQDYTDDYGDFLIVVEMEDLYRAIVQDQAKGIAEHQYELGYRRYAMALKMIEEFMNRKMWGEKIKVVMWGH